MFIKCDLLLDQIYLDTSKSKLPLSKLLLEQLIFYQDWKPSGQKSVTLCWGLNSVVFGCFSIAKNWCVREMYSEVLCHRTEHSFPVV